MTAVPRFVISGTHSGAGKTTIAAGLMAALRRRRLVVQGFKAGGDYVDPSTYVQATGRPGRNLDPWLMTPDALPGRLVTGAAGADIAVIEGMMGLYDGARSDTDWGSTAHVARQVVAPVVLVIDAAASARSVAATALGFKMFSPETPVAGVICNRAGGEAHRQSLRRGLEEVGLPYLGALGFAADLKVPEGRGGLALVRDDRLTAWIAAAADAVEAQIDLDRLVTLASAAPPLVAGDADVVESGRFRGVRLAVAHDEAFWHYYPETFALLDAWGVECLPFSPLRGEPLLGEVDGLLLSGGDLSLYAEVLAGHAAARARLAALAASGLPILAEGAAHAYVAETLVTADGIAWPMAACLPGTTVTVHSRLQAIGYRTADDGVRGHVFHYTRGEVAPYPPAWSLAPAEGGQAYDDGWRHGAIVASHLQLHHASDPRVLAAFLEQCRVFSARPQVGGRS